MIHDQNHFKKSEKAFLELGAGQIAYIRLLDHEALVALTGDSDMPVENSWAVFSANGDPMAICETPALAWEFAVEHELIAVSLH